METLNEFWRAMVDQAVSVVEDEDDLICNLANLSALVFEDLNKIKSGNVNWVGFYFYKQNQLVLGPFQGKLACCRIPLGRGVCGTAASTRTTQLVPNVHDFPGHIACDSASESEIVIPIFHGETLFGVFDLDSTVLNGFDEEDKKGLEEMVKKSIIPAFLKPQNS